MSKLFIDVLTLKPGKSLDDAEAYFAKAMPIIAKHGLKRREVIEISAKMRGHEDVNPHIVQIWEVDAENPFASLPQDAGYKALIATRDAIFEMSQLQGWFGIQR